MPNEEEEVIVDDLETNNEVEAEEEAEDVEPVVEKPQETLEQKRARLKRQLEQTEKKLGLKAEPKVEVQTEGLSQKDVIYLAKADIHEDDIEEVTRYAQKMGVPVKEAHAFYKPILKERAEERATAQATQTRGGQRSSAKETPEIITAQALRGEDTDPEKLAKARMAIKVKNLG